MARHIAQRARGPQRGPAGPHRGQEILLALEPEEALELSGEVRFGAVLGQRRGAHDHERARALDQRLARFEQRLQNFGGYGLIKKPEFDLTGHAVRLWTVRRGGPVRRLLEARRHELETVGRGVEAKPVRNRQAGLTQRRLVRGLGSEAIGVHRFVRGQGYDEFAHGFEPHDITRSDRRR